MPAGPAEGIVLETPIKPRRAKQRIPFPGPRPIPRERAGAGLRGIGASVGTFPIFGSPPKIGIGAHIKYVK